MQTNYLINLHAVAIPAILYMKCNAKAILMASVFTIQHHKTKITTAQSTEINILFRFDPKTTNQHQCFVPLTGFQK